MVIQPVFASSYLETLQTRAQAAHLAQDPYWFRLLHYRRNLLGIFQSEIDDASFFVSPRGRRDPQAELDATLALLFKPSSPTASGGGSMDLPAGRQVPPLTTAGNDGPCRYPARVAWLIEKLSIDSSALPSYACPRYEKWKSEMDPESVSLIFASFYMNNPSSMYGHSFLLLKKKGRRSEDELLDYAVNFAADMEGNNGALFAVKGLMGGYHGRFSTYPYYAKVQEYSNIESRDLWKYDLRLSPAAVDRLVQHLWELGNVRIRYFFLNKNCSYFLLPVLEVAAPERDFKKEFVFKAIPIDTLRAVIRQPGMMGSVTRRPSQASRLSAERAQLSEGEIQTAEKIAFDPKNVTKPLPDAHVLDAAYDLYRFRVGISADQAPEIKEHEHALLLLRNQAGGNPIPIPIPPVPAPDVGHSSGRIGLSYGFSNHSHFEELSLRPAVHDQDDPPQGYLPGSKLEMFHGKFRYDNDRKTFYLQQFALIDMLSITPWDRWIHPPSWKVNSGFAVANDLDRDPENSLYYGLNLGSGYSAYWPGSHQVLLFGMAEMELELGHAYTDDVRFGGGPSGGILWMPVQFYRARFAASYFPYAVGGTPATAKLGIYQSFSVTKSTDLRVKLERQNAYKEVLFSWVLFL